MTATAETIPQAVGDWQLRGIKARGYDLMFAPDELSDSAITAALRAQAKFRSPFPAWEAYRAILNGHPSYFPGLIEYATGVGLALMSAVRPDGRLLIRKPGAWTVQAAQDAMAQAVAGSYPAAASWRAHEFGISDKTYSRVRRAIAEEFNDAIRNFQEMIHSEAERVLRIDRQIR